MLKVLVLSAVLMAPQAFAGQDRACAARHVACMNKCMADWKTPKEVCEKKCGKLSDCDTKNASAIDFVKSLIRK